MFTLADSEQRADLVMRREIKYARPHADIGHIRGILEANCERLVYAHKVSTVRSIYFDDFRLSSAMANLNGLGRRRPATVFGLPGGDLVVLEGKSPLGQEHDLGKLMHPLRPRASRCSKYVHGCHHLDLLNLASGATAAD